MNQHRFSRREWLQSTSLLGLAAVEAPAAGFGAGEGAGNQKAIQLRPGLKQLFIDDRFFAERRGPVRAGNLEAAFLGAGSSYEAGDDG